MKKILSALLLLLLCAGFAHAQTVELIAASVGKADALLLRVDDSVALIDTGYPYSRGRLLYAMRQLGAEKLDCVIITHTDSDHVGGLEWIAAGDIPVGAWYTSAFYTRKEEKHEALAAAAARGQEIHYLKAGDSVPLGSATLRVLAPFERSENENDNSVVLRLDTPEGSMLLCGDIEFDGEKRLLDSDAPLKCDVLKVANHADIDTCSEAFLYATQPKAAIISTSSEEKPQTPARVTVSTLEEMGATVAVTERCTGGVRVTLANGRPEVRFYDAPAVSYDVEIETVDPERDCIVLHNRAATNADLGGSYLYSSKGGELLVLTEGTLLPAGGRLTIAAKDSELDGDLLWNEKKVVHRKKKDVITLYDPWGTAVSHQSNGLGSF